MSEEKRAPSEPMTADQMAQLASDTLKGQIAALRGRVKTAQQTLSGHLDRENDKPKG